MPVFSTIANCTIKIAFICVNVQNSESFQNSIDNFSKACYNTDILKPTGAATLPEKDEDKIMEKKFALVTEYGEINDSRAIKDIKAGKSSIYEAFDQLKAHGTVLLKKSYMITLKKQKQNFQSIKLLRVLPARGVEKF